MNTLTLIPRGNVTRQSNWNTNVVSYDNGSKQFQRKMIKPRVTFTFSTQGDKDMKDYLENFYDNQCGNLKPFYWEYEGTKYVVRFGDSSLDFTHVRGYGGSGVVGYEVQVALEVCKEGEY